VLAGERDFRDDVARPSGLEVWLGAGKAAPGGKPYKPKSTAVRKQGPHHSPVHLVNKAPQEHLEVCNQVIWGTLANIGL